MFSFDVFQPGLSFWEVLIAFLMHNIPTFILAIIVLIAWKHELVGAITFALFGILYTLRILTTAITNGFEWYYLSWTIQISGIALLTAVLFFINWKKKAYKSKR